LNSGKNSRKQKTDITLRPLKINGKKFGKMKKLTR